MTIRYTYITESHFSPSIERHYFKLRALPCENEFQHVLESQLEFVPSCRICHSIDGQGNAVQWGGYVESHTLCRITSQGIVQQRSPYVLHEEPAAYYRTPTRLTSWCAGMEQLVAGIDPHSPPFEQARALMHVVHQYVAYSPGSTCVSTTAADLFRHPQGVCQDYAHLLIALCRHCNIIARYANGLIAGQGETHAWVEVSDGHEWHAFDPTNDLEVQWGYVKIAHGRDADDCPTNRGRFFGWTREVMTVESKVEL